MSGDALKQERDEPEAEKAEGDAESQGPAAAPLASVQATWEAIQRVSVTEAAGGRENKNACWRYSMLVRVRAMSCGWPAGLQSERRQKQSRQGDRVVGATVCLCAIAP